MIKTHIPRRLMANGKSDIPQLNPADVREGRLPMLMASGGPIKLQAAASDGDGDGKKLRTFEILAYTGGAMRFWWSDDPVVVEIAGLKGTDRSRPIFHDHNPALIVGHTDKITVGNDIRLAGTVSGAGRVAKEVVDAADNGFPWEASIGVDIERIEYIEAGVSAKVNGRDFDGPLLVVRAGTFKETSFVALGADDETAAAMVASRTNTSPDGQKETTMDKTVIAWLKAQGWSQEDINGVAVGSAAHKTLQASHEASLTAGAAPAPATTVAPVADQLQAQREIQAAESERIASIRILCANAHNDIEAKAIREGWTKDTTELAVLRASRPQAPNLNLGAGGDVANALVLEAAACQAIGVSLEGVKKFDDKTLQAAHSRYRGRLGLGELILEAAWSQGFTGRTMRGDVRGALQAAFSSVEISGILSNIANRSLLAGFNSIEDAWRKIAKIASVRDFKAVTRYRMTGDATYDEVGPSGEIKHGELGEESYSNQAKTYAKMLAITRQDMINDDLGALDGAPNALGIGSARKFNAVFWATFLANSDFFKAGNSNLLTGAGSALGIDSYTASETKFLDQSADGHPLGIEPGLLLVPNALRTPAHSLMHDLEVRDTTKKATTGNPHAGKAEVVSSAYLNRTTISGGSATAWYMLASPNVLPVIEAAFLDGQQAPTIEQADADFNTLGIQLRGFHDFGVALQDYRGGVRNNGV